MTAQEFRDLALSLPGVIESSHMNHPDFRVNGKIFATLGSPDGDHGMVKLAPEDQRFALEQAPDAFTPAAGAWGRQGSTLVRLAAAAPSQVDEFLQLAWKLAANPPQGKAKSISQGRKPKR